MKIPASGALTGRAVEEWIGATPDAKPPQYVVDRLFHRLIAECHPAIVFGEQVASRAGRDWLAAVRADLEDVGYACGAADLCAAGVGAPHIRQRLFWGAARVENPMHSERWSVNVNGQDGCDGQDSGRKEAHGIAGARSQVCRLADMHGHRCDQAGECQPEAGHDGLVGNGAIGGVANAMPAGWSEGRPVAGHGSFASGGSDGGLADASGSNTEQLEGKRPGPDAEEVRRPSSGPAGRSDAGGMADADQQGSSRRRIQGPGEGTRPRAGTPRERLEGLCQDRWSGTDHGGWNAPDWLHCRDGKWRPVEPGTFPLAHGLPARVGRLRGYGNAIVPQCAEAFIRSFV